MNNDHEGKGGSYAIDENGEKVLLHRTQERPPGQTKPEIEPAPAGFFFARTHPATRSAGHGR